MAKNKYKLIIVESPHKATVIQKFLGKDFKVVASIGHIRDLPKGSTKAKMGIDVENDFAMTYVVSVGKEKKVDELKKFAKDASEIFLAPDPDREGEAIAWHLKEVLGLSFEEAKRITYQSITKKSILDALEKNRAINMNLVNAQQTRRALDRIVGFNLSPFLWKKIAKNLSAGRVQSPATRMVVEREKEIKDFVSEEYWTIDAIMSRGKEDFKTSLIKYDDKRYELGHDKAKNEEVVKNVLSEIKKEKPNLFKIETKESKSKASAPFITSTLQQSANTYLRYSTKRTMMVAQKLYEGMEIDGEMTGLITYMRTDSTYIDPVAQKEAKEFIVANYGANYVPEKFNFYASKNSQEAHEAIRPTIISLTPEKAKAYLGADEHRLYDIIWRRFMQSQMSNALFNTTVASISMGKALFEARGKIMLFDGFRKLKGEALDEKDDLLPDLKEGDSLTAKEFLPVQHFTSPPNRYNEASLVRALEKEGIGRPSTYAPIIGTIQERGYVLQKDRVLFATELGIAVTGLLEKEFDDIVDYHFTSSMEANLDKVEEGSKDWVEVLREFYNPFINKVEHAVQDAEPLKGRPWEGEERCPECGKTLTIKYSKSGAFLGCSAYPACKGTMNMPGEKGDDTDEYESYEKVDCPKCNSPMVVKKSRFGKVFYACTKYPDCKSTLSVNKEGKPIILPKTDEICEKCGKPMAVKMSRRGPFLACTGYPDCKNAKPLNK